jgi:hypothetical protein
MARGGSQGRGRACRHYGQAECRQLARQALRQARVCGAWAPIWVYSRACLLAIANCHWKTFLWPVRLSNICPQCMMMMTGLVGNAHCLLQTWQTPVGSDMMSSESFNTPVGEIDTPFAKPPPTSASAPSTPLYTAPAQVRVGSTHCLLPDA